uniref:Interleukin 32 n=1 Tax=Aotus nancymaae TaxID=37293 RepID=A0A2K5D9Y8_AOTNA
PLFLQSQSDDIKKLNAEMTQEKSLNGASIPQELTPLLEKERDELRRRSNRPPVLEVEDPETEEPKESFCDKVMRWFRAMLQRLQTWWQKFVAWVKEMAAAVVRKVKALWEVFESFCHSLAELLRSFCSTEKPHGGDGGAVSREVL